MKQTNTMEEADLIDLEALKDVHPKATKDKVVFDHTPMKQKIEGGKKDKLVPFTSKHARQVVDKGLVSIYGFRMMEPTYNQKLTGITKRTFMEKYGWVVKATIVCIIISLLLK